MKQYIKKEKTKDRMEYIARTVDCVLESIDEFLVLQCLSEAEKMDVKGILMCEMTKDMTESEYGMSNLIHVVNDMKNTIWNSSAGETQGTMK